MGKKKSPLTLVSSSVGNPHETQFEREQREDRELLERRGVGIGAVSRQLLAGMRLCLDLLQKGESIEDPAASLDRQFRDGPQFNFALPFLQRLRELDDPEVVAGFASVLSDFIQTGIQYNGSDWTEELIDAAEVSQSA